MGGFDIFKAEKAGERSWSNVTNLRFPLNSPADDYGIIFENESRGFLTSNRTGTLGSDDIFSFVMPPLTFTLQGTIFDAKTKTPIANATVSLLGSDGSSAELKTDASGKYFFADKGADRYILPNTSYQISASAQNYLASIAGKETTVGLMASADFVKDFELKPIEREIVFPEVLYDLAQYTLRPESKDSLDYLFKILKDNPQIVIELSAHTDSRGSDILNTILSENRAKSCVEYLISKGVAKDRLVAKGYGKSRLLISDAEINAMATEEEKEAAHQRNRRTVFSIVRSNYIPKGAIIED
jgi:peptidoglycan-associated lipoprotein